MTETSSRIARPLRFSRKCPPPGISQPRATAGAQTLMGGMGSFCGLGLDAIIVCNSQFIRSSGLGRVCLVPTLVRCKF